MDPFMDDNKKIPTKEGVKSFNNRCSAHGARGRFRGKRAMQECNKLHGLQHGVTFSASLEAGAASSHRRFSFNRSLASSSSDLPCFLSVCAAPRLRDSSSPSPTHHHANPHEIANLKLYSGRSVECASNHASNSTEPRTWTVFQQKPFSRLPFLQPPSVLFCSSVNFARLLSL